VSGGCAQCGAALTATDLACPSCHTLVHALELKQLAAEADAHAQAARPSEALAAWRRVLDLLPPESRQHAQVADKIAQLSRGLDAPGSSRAAPDVTPAPSTAGAPAAPPSALGKGAAAAGAVGLFVWKLKWVLLFVLGKGKLLILGLTKTSTLLSMLLSFGVYWTAFGWKFAIGLVLSIYVHEMGHVFAMRRYGFKASAPMFVPGLGAFVRLKQRPLEPREDARIGLAGPIWGAACAVALYGLFHATDWALLHAVAKVGAWINLFNLLPAWMLDGGRAFNALSRRQRLVCVGALAAAWFLTSETLLLVLAIVAAMRAAGAGAPAEGESSRPSPSPDGARKGESSRPSPSPDGARKGESSRPSPSPDGARKGDRRACIEYVVLVAVLAAVAAS
jgi:Zn-dependent protease